MIRVGVIGLDFGKTIHVPALRLDSRVRVEALCSTTPGRAKSLASELGVPRYFGDWREVLRDKSIDAVTIATPPSVQAAILPEAIRAGKHVFCEKPVGLGFHETSNWATKADEAQLAHMIDFEFAELETWMTLKSELSQIGRLRLAMVNWQVQASGYKEKAPSLASLSSSPSPSSSSVPSWKITMKDGGGTLRYLGCHCLYYLEWLFGPIESVGGTLSPDGQLVRVQITLVAGGAVELCVGGNSPGRPQHRLEVWGDTGRLTLSNDTGDYMKGFVLSEPGQNEKENRILKIESPSAIDGRISAVGGVLKKFIDWIETGKPQAPSLHEGARVEHLMESIELSNREKRIVEVASV